MDRKQYKYIIIGGGLSGLSAALQFKLQGEEDFVILEARDRVGGRILTKNEIDLGAAWIHDNHQTILNVAEHLGLETFQQYNRGKSYYKTDSAAPAQEFEVGQNEAASFRLKGGTSSLIDALFEKVKPHVLLNQEIESVNDLVSTVRISTSKNEFSATKVILTVPLRLASTLHFKPSLPIELIREMRDTHTWFSHAIKVGITYEDPFWRNSGKSGMVIDQLGDVIEIHDHTNCDGTQFSLMGFVNERLRAEPFEDQKLAILKCLTEYFGSDVQNYIDFKIFDWSEAEFTTGAIGLPNPRNTAYGKAVFQKGYYNSKLYFAGTESSSHHGGFMEGAVYKGLSIAQQLLKG